MVMVRLETERLILRMWREEDDFEPERIPGKPSSEIIIEERR